MSKLIFQQRPCIPVFTVPVFTTVKGEIAEGRLFRKLPGEEKTFREMMEKYLNEHVSKLKSQRAFIERGRC